MLAQATRYHRVEAAIFLDASTASLAGSLRRDLAFEQLLTAREPQSGLRNAARAFNDERLDLVRELCGPSP